MCKFGKHNGWGVGKMRLLAWTLLALLGLSSVAQAAEIDVFDGGEGWKIITIAGEISDGDDARFKNIAIATDQAIVMLESPGGRLTVGMEIGKTISIKGFVTAVPDGSICASACGLIWLAGKSRAMEAGSYIGFHAPHIMNGTKADVSSAGAGLVGAYLKQLGLNDDVVVYVTAPQPDAMQWLTREDARNIRLEISFIESKRTQTSSRLPTTQEFGEQQKPDSWSWNRPADEGDAYTPVPLQKPGQENREGEWVILHNSDLPGSDLPGMPLSASSVMQCQQHCQSNGLCVGFTFNVGYKACFLKDAVSVAYQFTGAISGHRWRGSPIARLGSDFGPNVRFQTNKGMEIFAEPLQGQRGVTLGWCQDQCISTPSCKAFNYYDDGQCLFVGSTKPVRKNERAHFGVRLN